MSDLKKISNAKIVLPEKVFEGDLIINGSVIDTIGCDLPIPEDCEIINAKGNYVLPGFIDIHINGAAGFDCTFGKYDVESREFIFTKGDYLEGMEGFVKKCLLTGCTKIIPTTITAPFEQVLKSVQYISEYKKDLMPYSSCIDGIMIEGNFIKDLVAKGAHNPEYFQKPDIVTVDKLIELSNGLVKIINLPPEWGGEIFDVIKYVAQKNMIPAAGHTSSSASDLNKAVSIGTKLAIHMFNGPSTSSFKPFNNGGAIEEMLRNDSLMTEIIVDGVHVDKSYVMDAIRRKGIDNVIAVTDAMFTVGLDDLKEFKISGKVGCVSENGKFLFIKEKPDALFGSNLTMDVAFANLVNWFSSDMGGVWYRKHEAIELDKVIVASSKLCSYNAAKLLNIEEECGSIAVGKKADLVIGELSENDGYEFDVKSVLLNGEKING